MNKEENIKRQMKWNQEHREKTKEYNKRWYSKHKKEITEHRQQYKREHPEVVALRAASFAERRKRLILTHYGNGRCACVKCSFDDIRALSVDHINAIGTGERKKRAVFGGTNFYCWLINNGFPEGFQTLCMNCQWIKRFENKEHNTKEYAIKTLH